jgi:hypothetical protein
MKKLILMGTFALMALGANAQLKVFSNGTAQIGVGGPKFVGVLQTAATITDGNVAQPTPAFDRDSIASLTLFHPKNNLGTGAYITFGSQKNVSIGESPNLMYVLNLYSREGLEYYLGNNKIFSKMRGASAFTFTCDVKATSFLTDSDSRLKSDVAGLDGLGSSLASITPVSYKLTSTPDAAATPAVANADATTQLTTDGDTGNLTPSDRTRYGFIAQEVKEIFPDLVVEDENGYMSIDYLGFIPILVDAYRNLESKVKEQEEVIAQLTPESNNRARKAGVDDVIGDGKATLLQNRPNPFRDTTVIGCTVPEGSAEAFICIYDLQGKQVLHLDIEERGNCSVQVDGNSLQAGMYIYALIIDGAEIDSRKMILTD